MKIKVSPNHKSEFAGQVGQIISFGPADIITVQFEKAQFGRKRISRFEVEIIHSRLISK